MDRQIKTRSSVTLDPNASFDAVLAKTVAARHSTITKKELVGEQIQMKKAIIRACLKFRLHSSIA